MNNIKISCCYHPTVVVAVDDNRKYHNIIKLAVDSRSAICQFYTDPSKALLFLQNQSSPSSLLIRGIRELEDQAADKRNIEIDIRAIRQELNNDSRFNEIAVVILDYAMPSLNGGELALHLKDSPFKIILLTGEADAQVAVKLFNQGTIHSYIRKDEPHFDSVLNKAIHNLQQEYFQDLSTIVINSLAQYPDLPHFWFRDPEFKLLLEQTCKENDIVEYYLLDEFGSFLLLNAQGKPSWLAVTNEEMMKTYLLYATGDAPAGVVEGIRTKQMMPFFFSEKDFKVPPSNWQSYMHPAQILQGQETYYYSYIADSKAYPLEGKIVSYDEFLKNQE